MTDEAMHDPYDALFASPKPDWAVWATKSQTPLWCAVSLACNIDPSYFQIHGQRMPPHVRPYPANMDELLSLAKGNIGASGILRPLQRHSTWLEECEVSLANFATWLASIRHPLPAGFPWTPEEPDFTQLDWPWGRHSTDLLRKLAEAGNKFWKHYDPADATTAPTNKQVTDWLIAQNVAERTAEVMATVLRADGLRTGPRK